MSELVNTSTSVENEIVITGCGAITPLGHDIHSHLAALYAGKSAVVPLEPFSGIEGMHWLGAPIVGFDPKDHVQPRKAIKVMCYEIQLAFGASMQACRNANIELGTVAPDRIGTVFSSEINQGDITAVEDVVAVCLANGEMDHSRWGRQAIEHMYPLWMLRSLPNMAACHVGIALDARGPNNTITTEGTSGLGAILEGINVIRRDKADVIVVGSASSRICDSRLVQRVESDFSRSFHDGSRICKPFDSNRDGTVAGECGSAVVLERRSHAEQRGAKILGTIVGWSNTFFPSHPKRWSGVEQATAATLKQLSQRTGLSSSQIDHINACANGTIAADSAEAKGIHASMPDVPVVSYKGAIGDAISGAGIVEWMASLYAMMQQSIPPTTNHQQTAADCPVPVISGTSKNRQSDTFIKLSHTPTGRCVGIATRLSN